MRIAIVGPTKAGKSVYLACLLRAGFARRAARPIKVRPDPAVPAAVALDRGAVEILRGGSIAATDAVTRVELFADLPGSVLFGIGRETLGISMVDVPGGDCMPAPGFPVSSDVIKLVADADALLVMVPADPTVRPEDFGSRLKDLVGAAVRLRSAKSAYPFLRVAVVMSMAELLVADRGRDALRAIEGLEAKHEIAEICGPSALDVMRSLVPPGGDWYSLVSAFGFDSQTGEIAAEHTSMGWRMKLNGGEFRKDWWPYRAFEPLEFLGRGVCWRESF